MCANYTIALPSDSLGSPIGASPGCESLMRDPVLQKGSVKHRQRQLERQKQKAAVPVSLGFSSLRAAFTPYWIPRQVPLTKIHQFKWCCKVDSLCHFEPLVHRTKDALICCKEAIVRVLTMDENVYGSFNVNSSTIQDSSHLTSWIFLKTFMFELR